MDERIQQEYQEFLASQSLRLNQDPCFASLLYDLIALYVAEDQESKEIVVLEQYRPVVRAFMCHVAQGNYSGSGESFQDMLLERDLVSLSNTLGLPEKVSASLASSSTSGHYDHWDVADERIDWRLFWQEVRQHPFQGQSLQQQLQQQISADKCELEAYVRDANQRAVSEMKETMPLLSHQDMCDDDQKVCHCGCTTIRDLEELDYLRVHHLEMKAVHEQIREEDDELNPESFVNHMKQAKNMRKEQQEKRSQEEPFHLSQLYTTVRWSSGDASEGSEAARIVERHLRRLSLEEVPESCADLFEKRQQQNEDNEQEQEEEEEEDEVEANKRFARVRSRVLRIQETERQPGIGNYHRRYQLPDGFVRSVEGLKKLFTDPEYNIRLDKKDSSARAALWYYLCSCPRMKAMQMSDYFKSGFYPACSVKADDWPIGRACRVVEKRWFKRSNPKNGLPETGEHFVFEEFWLLAHYAKHHKIDDISDSDGEDSVLSMIVASLRSLQDPESDDGSSFYESWATKWYYNRHFARVEQRVAQYPEFSVGRDTPLLWSRYIRDDVLWMYRDKKIEFYREGLLSAYNTESLLLLEDPRIAEFIKNNSKSAEQDVAHNPFLFYSGPLARAMRGDTWVREAQQLELMFVYCVKNVWQKSFEACVLEIERLARQSAEQVQQNPDGGCVSRERMRQRRLEIERNSRIGPEFAQLLRNFNTIRCGELSDDADAWSRVCLTECVCNPQRWFDSPEKRHAPDQPQEQEEAQPPQQQSPKERKKRCPMNRLLKLRRSIVKVVAENLYIGDDMCDRTSIFELMATTGSFATPSMWESLVNMCRGTFFTDDMLLLLLCGGKGGRILLKESQESSKEDEDHDMGMEQPPVAPAAPAAPAAQQDNVYAAQVLRPAIAYDLRALQGSFQNQCAKRSASENDCDGDEGSVAADAAALREGVHSLRLEEEDQEHPQQQQQQQPRLPITIKDSFLYSTSCCEKEYVNNNHFARAIKAQDFVALHHLQKYYDALFQQLLLHNKDDSLQVSQYVHPLQRRLSDDSIANRRGYRRDQDHGWNHNNMFAQGTKCPSLGRSVDEFQIQGDFMQLFSSIEMSRMVFHQVHCKPYDTKGCMVSNTTDHHAIPRLALFYMQGTLLHLSEMEVVRQLMQVRRSIAEHMIEPQLIHKLLEETLKSLDAVNNDDEPLVPTTLVTWRDALSPHDNLCASDKHFESLQEMVAKHMLEYSRVYGAGIDDSLLRILRDSCCCTEEEEANVDDRRVRDMSSLFFERRPDDIRALLESSVQLHRCLRQATQMEPKTDLMMWYFPPGVPVYRELPVLKDVSPPGLYRVDPTRDCESYRNPVLYTLSQYIREHLQDVMDCILGEMGHLRGHGSYTNALYTRNLSYFCDKRLRDSSAAASSSAAAFMLPCVGITLSQFKDATMQHQSLTAEYCSYCCANRSMDRKDPSLEKQRAFFKECLQIYCRAFEDQSAASPIFQELMAIVCQDLTSPRQQP